ncbi:MAG: hypothetical protein IKM61_06620 [Eubacteriaceae bacterium]|nr:hypothetical protein [Eubacteriaceae bacterium]
MFWIFEIPIMFIVIVAMLVGAIKPGGALQILGWIAIASGAVIYFKSDSNERMSKDSKSGYYMLSILICITGGVLILFGLWFGEHTLFEFLFGTYWF